MDTNLNHVEQLEAALTLKQISKLEAVRRNVEVAIARQYGNRLSPIVSDMLLKDVILRPDVLAHLEGATVTEMPGDAVGWNRIACELVDADELAQRNLSFNDAELRQQLRNEALLSISPHRRLSLAREGKLAAILDTMIEEALEAHTRH
jgi:hypothetical protein